MITDPWFFAVAVPAIPLMGTSKGAIAIGFVLQRYLPPAATRPAVRSTPNAIFRSACSGIASTIAHAGVCCWSGPSSCGTAGRACDWNIRHR